MLAHILALAVGFASFCLYMSAFFFPEVHRKYDFAWSGVGMFYALVLWVCAGRITGGVLLGQTASVALLGWLGWQTLSLRRSLTPIELQTPLPGGQTVGGLVQTKLRDLQTRLQNSPAQGVLTNAKEWTNVLKDSVAKPKQPRRPPPPELRPTAAAAPISQAPRRSRRPQPSVTPAQAEAEAAHQVEQAAAVVEDLIGQAAAEVEPAPAIEPPAPERPVAPIVAETVDEFEEFDPETLEAPAPERPSVKPTRAAKRGNWFDALRARLQGQRRDRPTQPSRKVAAPSLEELADELEDFPEDFPEAEVMVAVLEESLPPDRVVEVEILEVTSAASDVVVETIEVEMSEPPAEPLHDDLEAADSASVTLADAVMEAELNWEADAPASTADADRHASAGDGAAEWTDNTPIGPSEPANS